MEQVQPDTSQRIKELIENARSIAIMPSEVSGADAFSAAVGLYHTLKALEKNVNLVYVGEIPQETKRIINREEITKDIYSRQLKILIDYSDTPASKLSYANNDHVLELVLAPVSKEFDRSKIRTQIQGQNYDLIITLGVQTPSDLGLVYTEMHETFDSATVVNLDNTKLNTKYGDLNLVNTQASNLSEVVFNLLSKIETAPNGKAAKALLVGMSYREPQG